MAQFKYSSTKTYGHDLGLSACFRQWRAKHSHCSLLHGYALSFHFEFGANYLDARHWVVDFGGLKELKEKLFDMFDHKLVVAADDPLLDMYLHLGNEGLADVRVLMDGVGCEQFAKLAYHLACEVVHKINTAEYNAGGTMGRVQVVSCEVREHGANSAIYRGLNYD